MDLQKTVVVEYQSIAAQEVLSATGGQTSLMAPGGTTTCLGCTCTSCCCSAATVRTVEAA